MVNVVGRVTLVVIVVSFFGIYASDLLSYGWSH